MRGGDGAGLRDWNERRLLEAAARAETLSGEAPSRADLARATGLSGQAVANIVGRLVAQGLMVEGERRRGRVGQPSVPVSVAATGAYGIGVKIGRGAIEGMAVDLLGREVGHLEDHLAAPRAALALPRAVDMAKAMIQTVPKPGRDRIVGLGLALPGDMTEWAAELGLPEQALADWAGLDPAARLREATGLEVHPINDAAAACAAEMLSGDAIGDGSAAYLYVGAFAGGGIVDQGRLMRGRRGRAGALGSLPVGAAGPDGTPGALIGAASAAMLMRALRAAGVDAYRALRGRPDAREQAAAEQVFADWAAIAAPALARAAAAARAVIDADVVVIDGVLPPDWRAALVGRVREETARLDLRGLGPAEIREGRIGGKARVIGAAMLPLHLRFAPDPRRLAGGGATDATPRA